MADTQILIWFLEGNSLLSASRRQIIADSQNDVFISIASLWEMAIKVSIGKLTLAQPLGNVINQLMIDNISILSITSSHALEVSVLPFHHRDPFDRLVIAQSKIDDLPVMTDDTEFQKYDIKTL